MDDDGQAYMDDNDDATHFATSPSHSDGADDTGSSVPLPDLTIASSGGVPPTGLKQPQEAATRPSSSSASSSDGVSRGNGGGAAAPKSGLRGWKAHSGTGGTRDEPRPNSPPGPPAGSRVPLSEAQLRELGLPTLPQLPQGFRLAPTPPPETSPPPGRAPVRIRRFAVGSLSIIEYHALRSI